MKRRDFTKGALATGLVTATGQPLRADNSVKIETGPPAFDNFGRLILLIGALTVTVLFIYLVVAGRIFRFNTNRQLPRSNEDRISLPGGLTTPTINKRFAGSERIGDVRHQGDSLFVISSINFALKYNGLYLSNQKLGWNINTRAQEVNVSGNLGSLPLVGHFFRTRDSDPAERSLLIDVRPSITNIKF